MTQGFFRTFAKVVIAILVLFTIWSLFVHESAHYIVCELEGNDAYYGFEGLQPKISCDDRANHSDIARFIQTMAPYMLDLAVLLLLVFIPRQNLLVRVLPHVVMLDVLGNSVLANLQGNKNDFLVLFQRVPSMFWFSVVLVVVISLVWVVLYGRDLIEVTRKTFKLVDKNSLKKEFE